MALEQRPLNRKDLLPTGPLRRLGRRVFVRDTIESTNKLLLERAQEAGDGAVAYAECQTAGRGRLGRRWLAPRGSSVLMSVLLIEPADSPLQSQGALLGAVAACEAIEQTTDISPVLRWPNDLMHGGRKLGGVLAESCTVVMQGADRPDRAGAGQRAVVIGIGINCLQQRGHFGGELFDKATSLDCETDRPVHRGPVAASLLARVDHWLGACAEKPDGWAGMRAAWRIRCEDVGTHVTLEESGQTFTGTALDISDEGSLIVQLDQGGRRYFASATTTRVW